MAGKQRASGKPSAPSVMSSRAEPITPQDRELVTAGQEAAARVKRSASDWIAIGKAVDVGKRYAMRLAGKNQPRGKAYCTHFDKWLTDNKFDWIGKTTRSKLLQMVDKLPAVEEFLAAQPEEKRHDLNNPVTVMARFTAAKRELDPEKPTSPYRKLRDSVAQLEERNDRLTRDLEKATSFDKKPSEIAAALVAASPNKARLVATEIEKLLAEEVAGVLEPAK
jgi:hypothetical protein